ncbi:MAG: PD-(D/E)XK nuclease family protein [Myxococcota bacterium]
MLSDVAATLKIAIPPRPAHLEKDEEWENQLGNVLHNTMELWGMVPSQRPDTGALRRLAVALLPTDGEALDLDWLLKCMDMLEQSELGREMAAAAARGELWHELPFNLHLPADATSTRPELALSGRVDALFRDAEGRWVVVDYKLTKKGAPGTMAELQASYGKQLLAYRAALQECGLGPVSRAGLWLAASGVAVWLTSGSGANENP